MKPFVIDKGPFAGMTVVAGDQTRVRRFADALDRILAALGHPEAFVTDASSVGDFSLDDEALHEAAVELGVELRHGDLLVDVAEKLTGVQ